MFKSLKFPFLGPTYALCCLFSLPMEQSYVCHAKQLHILTSCMLENVFWIMYWCHLMAYKMFNAWWNVLRMWNVVPITQIRRMEDAKSMERRYLIMGQHFQQHQIGCINRRITIQHWLVELITLYTVLFLSTSFLSSGLHSPSTSFFFSFPLLSFFFPLPLPSSLFPLSSHI